MLIEFNIGNFRSFKDPVTFSMVAGNITSQDKRLDDQNVVKLDNDLSILKSAAIYGANGSGKSNFGRALKFMRKYILRSSKDTQIGEDIGVESFRLSPDTKGKPSFFEII